MGSDSVAATDDHPKVLYRWSARKVHPVVLLYVALVFVAMMLFSYFVVHSMTAVKALAMTAVASMVPLVPSVLEKVEYRLTDKGLEKRPIGKESPKSFEIVFVWEDVNHIVPVSNGFKFYKPLEESNPLVRFWKLHVSDEYSGEVHVEKADKGKVLELLRQRGISS